MFTEELKAELNEPINDTSFCGVYLKADKDAFRALRNTFNIAQTSLRDLNKNPDESELEQLVETNVANWQALSSELLEVFKTKTRDIELLGWFSAAQLSIDDSFEGLRNTFAYLNFLLENHWDNVNPLLPESKLDGLEDTEKSSKIEDARAKAFAHLVGDREDSSVLYLPILQIALAKQITYADYLKASQSGTASELSISENDLSEEESAEIVARLTNIEESLTSLTNIEASVQKNMKSHSVRKPIFANIKLLLNKVKTAIETITGLEARAAESSNETPEVDSPKKVQLENNLDNSMESSTVNSRASDTSNSGNSLSTLKETIKVSIDSRKLAFEQLKEISEFIKSTEPHSPVSLLLDKAIAWGKLSLSDLYKEMMSEGVNANFVAQLLNNKAPVHTQETTTVKKAVVKPKVEQGEAEPNPAPKKVLRKAPE